MSGPGAGVTAGELKLVHFDLLRGLAALAVCAGHLRGFAFVDWENAARRGPLDAAFYFATGLGHQAVMVFFVMSGFLVGGNALKAFRAGRFSWGDYALRRLTRLWIVLLPALALTLAWDSLGSQLSGGVGYDGAYRQLLSSGPRAASEASLALSTLLGNALFLQNFLVPTYGTNGPLWSLTNEFWYYVLFPLAVGAYYRRGTTRIVCASCALALCAWLPADILLGGLVWLMGVISSLVMERVGGSRSSLMLLWRALGLAITAGSLVASRMGHWFGSDLVLGACVAATLPSLSGQGRSWALYRKVATASAEVSYTLYLTHFPLVACVWIAFVAPYQQQPSLASYGLYLSSLTALLLYAGALWWLFERRTQDVLGWARRLVFGPVARPAAVDAAPLGVQGR